MLRFSLPLVVGGFVALLAAAAQQKEQPVRIGMIRSLFDEKNEKAILAQTKPFADMVQKRTGTASIFVVVPDADFMGRELKAGQLHLGVLHGVEYAWMKKECPDCRPLLVAINETTTLKAYLLVRQDSPAKSISDLKGAVLSTARRTPQHVRFYLDRLAGAPAADFFKTLSVDDTDAAVEAVIEGKAQATAVSGLALDVFRTQKPGRARRLKVLAESPSFPAAVVVYRPGQGKQTSLQQFRDALQKANQNAEGRQTLTLWRLTGFHEVPKDYDTQVAEILKHYPEP